MPPAVLWLLGGSVTAWLTLLASPLTLLAWLAGYSIWPGLLISALLAPVVFTLIMRSLRNDGSRKVRWLWLQSFGLSAVLMPLMPIGAVLTLFLPTPSVGLLVLCAWVVLSLLAVHRATQVREHHLQLSAPQLAKPMRLVQISDVHIGSRDKQFLERVVAQVKQHEPELVMITGDLLDTRSVSADDLAALATLDCPSYMCLGNHERYVDLAAAITAIEAVGVQILRDAATTLDKLHIIGIDDRDRPLTLPELVGGLARTEHYQVLLYHRPDGWAAACEHNIDLTLSGHTHGGQIWPFGMLVKRQYPHMIGRFSSGKSELYVSPGTGTWGPTFRLGTRCEMTIIDLQP